jgi:hypothetical protein
MSKSMQSIVCELPPDCMGLSEGYSELRYPDEAATAPAQPRISTILFPQCKQRVTRSSKGPRWRERVCSLQQG